MTDRSTGRLKELGYTRVRYYRGGLENWLAHPQELERGTESAKASGVPASALMRHGENWASKLLTALEHLSTRRLLLAWVWMLVACAVSYWLAGWIPGQGLAIGGEPLQNDLPSFFTALYFSGVVATTLGFGDVSPLGVVRGLAVAEAAGGLLIFGAIVSKLVSRRQQLLVEEIHRSAFEERVDRVQTKLHVLIMDLQYLSVTCRSSELEASRAVARLESTVMVFVAELRIIHDLLHRPQQDPGEQVLETILASLAAALGELASVLECTGALHEEARTLEQNLRLAVKLTSDFCSDCVPGEHAPALRDWMDRVRELAHKLKHGSAPPDELDPPRREAHSAARAEQSRASGG